MHGIMIIAEVKLFLTCNYRGRAGLVQAGPHTVSFVFPTYAPGGGDVLVWLFPFTRHATSLFVWYHSRNDFDVYFVF